MRACHCERGWKGVISAIVKMTFPTQLITPIRQMASRPFPGSVHALTQKILASYGHTVQAILFYGSCFRKGDDADGMVDLYVIVDNYRHAYRRLSHAFFNELLPPNVFYLEVPYQGRMSRAKYAVFSSKDFHRGTSMHWFHSYLWGRLAQPVSLTYARNTHIVKEMHIALARAAVTFITRVLPIMPPRFTCRELWSEGLALSYSAELRTERHDKVAGLFDANMLYYEELTQAAMGMVPFFVETMSGSAGPCYRARVSDLTRISCRFAWIIRRLEGKGLSILRLLKGLLTFQGGLNYILWKIERHSGVTVQMDTRLRRVPLLGVGMLFWRLYKRGAFR
jgi:hypothetical protein